jgi:hypothetical protein
VHGDRVRAVAAVWPSIPCRSDSPSRWKRTLDFDGQQ